MADYDLLLMGAPFESKRIFVTGGTGFLGGAVRRSLAERGVTDVIAPSSTDVDFRSPTATNSAIADAAPDIVLHLAARVGGIGANRKPFGQSLEVDHLRHTMLPENAFCRGMPAQGAHLAEELAELILSLIHI